MAEERQQQDVTAEQAEQIWRQAAALAMELPAIRDEAVSFWEEASALLDEGSEGEAGHPRRRAEYLAALASLHEFMERTIPLLRTVSGFRERNRQMDAPARMKAFSAAAARVDQQKIKGAFFAEAIEALRSDMKTVGQYHPMLKLTQSGACMAAYSPLHFVREVLAAYLNKPPAGAATLELTIAVVKSVGIDFLAKANPVIGPALALAEAMKAHSERRGDQLRQGLAERDRLLFFEDGIREAFDVLGRSEATMDTYRASADELDAGFDRAATRGKAMLDAVAK